MQNAIRTQPGAITVPGNAKRQAEECPSCAKLTATRETWGKIEGGSFNSYWRITCPCGHAETNDIFT